MAASRTGETVTASWSRASSTPTTSSKLYFMGLSRRRPVPHTVTKQTGTTFISILHRGRHAAVPVHHADRSPGWAAGFIHDGLGRRTWISHLQARKHHQALARCDASSTSRLKLRKNPTITHETRPCTRRITLRLIDSLYARAPAASLQLIELSIYIGRHQGTRFKLHPYRHGRQPMLALLLRRHAPKRG